MKRFNAPERECSVGKRDRDASCSDSFRLRDHSSSLLTVHYWRYWGYLRRDGYIFFSHGRLLWVGKASHLSGLLGCVRYPRIAESFHKVFDGYSPTSASVSGERNELSESVEWNGMEWKNPNTYLYERNINHLSTLKP